MISLSVLHHAEQHRIGEARFERRYAMDLRQLAAAFATVSPHEGKLTDWLDPKPSFRQLVPPAIINDKTDCCVMFRKSSGKWCLKHLTLS